MRLGELLDDGVYLSRVIYVNMVYKSDLLPKLTT